MDGLINRLLAGSTDFARSFRRNEFKALAHRGGSNTVLWLGIIVGLTLTALAFAAGSVEQLRERMDNPFTNIVDKGIYRGDRAAFERVRRDLLANDDLSARMGLDTITDWSVYVLNAFPAGAPLAVSSEKTLSLRGRTVDYTSSLFNFVFTPDNILRGGEFAARDRTAANNTPAGGIIIKAAVLNRLGYTVGDFDSLRSVLIYQNSLDAVVLLPVHAIVRDLPSNADFVSSKDFYLSITGEGCVNQSFIYNREGDNNLRFVVTADEEQTFLNAARQIIAGPDAGLEVERQTLVADGRRELLLINLRARFPYVQSRKAYYSEVLRGLDVALPGGWVPYVRYERTNKACKSRGAQQASFVFNRLDQIRDFRNYLLENSGIDLPTEVVENKENFARVSFLGLSIGLVLLLFSIASICFFVRNLIEGHLNEIRPNLGTFKAFGISNEALVRHYQAIISVLLTLSVVVGIGLAATAGLVIRLLAGPGHFSLLSPWVVVSLAIIAIFTTIFARRVVRRILSKSPGDLVYGRG